MQSPKHKGVLRSSQRSRRVTTRIAAGVLRPSTGLPGIPASATKRCPCPLALPIRFAPVLLQVLGCLKSFHEQQSVLLETVLKEAPQIAGSVPHDLGALLLLGKSNGISGATCSSCNFSKPASAGAVVGGTSATLKMVVTDVQKPGEL